MSAPNALNLPFEEKQEPIEIGDAVVILKKNGETQMMTCGVDQDEVERIRNTQPHDMSEGQLDLALQGQRLFLLTMAAESEVIMDFLARVASLPGSVSMGDRMVTAATAH